MNVIDEAMLLSMLEPSTRGAHVVGRPVPMLKRIVKPALTWEAAVPGLQFPLLEYVVTAADVDWYLQFAGKLGLPRSSAPPDVVPIGIFADEPMQCIATLFGRSGRLHVSHSIETYCAIPVGATIRSRASVVRRHEQRGRKLVDVLCGIHVVAANGETEAMRITATLMP